MTTRTALVISALIALPSATLLAQHDHDMAMAGETGPPPLYTNLGTLHRAIRTTSPQAQKYFDQGLRLTYAFNHAEAVASFQRATELDPTCAMCWWGIANALGPNINLPMMPEAVAPAYAATQRALALASKAGPADRALIEATAVRYAEKPPADRSPLDSAYTDKLRAAAKRFPSDPDIGALYGESMLDLRPWNQWQPDGTPLPGTLEAVAALERVIAKYPNHVGACHFYIHAVEASLTPEKALPCANRLPGLMPGAGHLVHMPAHIAIRLGDYDAAIRHNQHAVHADQMYFDGPHINSFYGAAYYPHNLHFLSVAAAMSGKDSLAIDAARQTAAAVPLDLARQIPPLEFWLPMPYFALLRFQRWDEMLAEPAPAEDLHYTKAMWLFSQGMAQAHLGPDHLSQAKTDLDSLEQVRQMLPADDVVGIQSADRMLGIAREILGGTIASQDGRPDEAVTHLKAAVELEDGLSYDEPPPWYTPARELLGEELLAQGKATEAAEVFRADLRQYRKNSLSEEGLAKAVRSEK